MPHHNVFLPYVNLPGGTPAGGFDLQIINDFIRVSATTRAILTTFLPKNYPPSYNFGPRAGLRGATFGCAFFSLGGSTIRSLSFSVLRS